MTSTPDVSIQVGNVTLSTANVPEDGIDLNNLSADSKRLLSIFDSNNDGKLSKAEIHKAIIKLANADKTRSEEYGDKILITKKDGKLDNFELENLKMEITYSESTSDRTLKTLESLNKIVSHEKETLDILTKAQQNGASTEDMEKYLRGEYLANAKKILKEHDSKTAKRAAESYEIKNAAKELQRAMVTDNEIKKKGLQKTYNENWLKDAEGNHYRYNESAMKFEKVDNVEYVGKDGSYRTLTKNDKGQQIFTTFIKKDESFYQREIKVQNSEGKTYVNPEYVAKIAGLKIEWDPAEGYRYVKNGTIYDWDDERHLFGDSLGVNDIYF